MLFDFKGILKIDNRFFLFISVLLPNIEFEWLPVITKLLFSFLI